MAIIYIAEETEKKCGDSWDIVITYNLEEAIKEAKYRYDRLTASEKKRNAVEIRGYELDVDTTKDAKEEFIRVTEDMCFYPDPIYYNAIVKFEVDFYDERNGVASPIDTIEAFKDYTAENYIEDCKSNADDDWNEMLTHGTVTLTEV